MNVFRRWREQLRRLTRQSEEGRELALLDHSRAQRQRSRRGEPDRSQHTRDPEERNNPATTTPHERAALPKRPRMSTECFDSPELRLELTCEAARLVERLRPNLLVVEIAVREGAKKGMKWLEENSDRFAELNVVVCSRNGDQAAIAAALAGGVSVYVVKRAHASDVTAAVRQLHSRSLYLPHQGGTPPRPRPGSDFGLTKREIEILALAAQGRSNQQMARHLWVTEQTIKFHLSNVYKKIGVRNRTAASRFAHMHNLASDGNT